MSRPPMSTGLSNSLAALQLLAPETTGSPTLSELTARLSHLKGSQDDWRESVAFLASQVHAERNVSDAAKARDARFALAQIGRQVEWFTNLHGGAA